MIYWFDIVPVKKPRMTQRDRWANRPPVIQYFHYANELKALAFNHRFILGKQIEVMFLIPMPESWSKKKKEAMKGQSHEQTPDTDNLLKAFCDALKDQDSDVWSMKGSKFWWDKGAVVVIENKAESGEIGNNLWEEAKKTQKEVYANY